MARAGDHYTVELKASHLDWGGYRHSQTRNTIKGEGYVPIPKSAAVKYNILIGSTYTAVFEDGFPTFRVRAAGNSKAGDIYAKQFQGDGDLKAFGNWFIDMNAKIGDYVIVTFLDEGTINFELISK